MSRALNQSVAVAALMICAAGAAAQETSKPRIAPAISAAVADSGWTLRSKAGDDNVASPSTKGGEEPAAAPLSDETKKAKRAPELIEQTADGRKGAENIETPSAKADK